MHLPGPNISLDSLALDFTTPFLAFELGYAVFGSGYGITFYSVFLCIWYKGLAACIFGSDMLTGSCFDSISVFQDRLG